MIIRWSTDNKWLYAADVSAQWVDEGEIVLTVSFGPESDPTTGITKNASVGFYRNTSERISLQQENILLNLVFTWEDPVKKQTNPKICFEGNIVETKVSVNKINVGVNACLNTTVEAAS